MSIKRYGPYGNQTTPNWEFGLRNGERIQEIILHHGHIVDGIQFSVVSPNGVTNLRAFGGRGGALSKISMKPDEYILQISGMEGVWTPYVSYRLIASITIHTNLNPTGYGPYGEARDVGGIKSFASPVLRSYGPIIEFFGVAEGYLRSIGVGISDDSHDRVS